MPVLARGAAFVEPSGALVVADPGFRRALGLPDGEAGAAFRALVAGDPALAALIDGGGPDAVAVAGPGGEPVRVERHRSPAGLLLLVRAGRDADRLEHAAHSSGLAQLAAGLSHDVNGPLNTMTLQLALLEEKLGDAGGAPPVAPHLGALREQVARVARMVRRFREVADPPAALGGVDLGATAAEIVGLMGHDLHLREIQLAADLPAGQARTVAPPERAVRLVHLVLQQAAQATPRGGTLAVEVGVQDGWATLSVVHSRGAAPPDVGYDSEVAARAAAGLGGRLTRTAGEGRERVTLLLPRGQPA